MKFRISDNYSKFMKRINLSLFNFELNLLKKSPLGSHARIKAQDRSYTQHCIRLVFQVDIASKNFPTKACRKEKIGTKKEK